MKHIMEDRIEASLASQC